MRLIPPGDAPDWMQRHARDVEAAVRAPADGPRQLKAYANAAALPAAKDWPFGLVYVSDIAMAAVSTGSAWKRLDTGATI